MCRNIRVLHHFEPPATPDEIEAAALQYVRKVSGLVRPTKADEADFARAVKAVAEATAHLLRHLPERGHVRTREAEKEKARSRWITRAARIADSEATTRR